MKEIIRLYWQFRTGGATRDEAIEWALTKAEISAENLEFAYAQVVKELDNRRAISATREVCDAR